jgi:hypothetical protein
MNYFFRKIYTSAAILFVAIAAISANVDAAIYSAIEMSNVNVKGSGNVAKVAPGEAFAVSANYEFLVPREQNSLVQIIVGYHGIGAKVCIAHAIVAGDKYLGDGWKDITKKKVDFLMFAPEEPGTYEIRFRYAQAYTCSDAVKYWWNIDSAPTEDATIATIIVESKSSGWFY